MSKKLSIIVPVYNMATEGKLNYCLDSLVGQTIRGLYDYEILCVDDASTDDSLEILLDYQKRYPELVCVIPNPVNLRQGGAKNAGLRVAQGEWIGFIDSDDWVSPDYYEKLLKKAEDRHLRAGATSQCYLPRQTVPAVPQVPPLLFRFPLPQSAHQ